jgi:HD-GYP domain-containing protein (c-di-GMP phosphodiesterase class II)
MNAQSQARHTAKRGIKIPVSELKIGMQVCELDRDWLETPFALQGFTIHSAADVAEIARYCREVFIEPGSDRQPRERSQAPAAITVDRAPDLPLADWNAAKNVHQNARALTRSFMDDVRLGRAIDIREVKATVSSCVQSILHNPDAMLWIAKIRDRDQYTSDHSLNVGLLAISFGRYLGASEEDLNRLGLVGMLHDVGKMYTPLEVLNKEGPLDAEEMSIMQRHTKHGRDILISHRGVCSSAVDVALSHHEALDGSGYPRKVKAAGISDLTRIITLCDVYDAITSDRVYKKGKPALEALRFIYNSRGRRFDERLTEHFVKCFGVYPPGTIVALYTGEVGIVINTNHQHRHLPRVLVVLDSEKCPQPERVIDLERVAKEQDQAQPITDPLPNGSFGIRIETYIDRGLVMG